jgi:site-specific recombinase XerD
MFAQEDVTNSNAIGRLAPEFLLFAEVELSFAKETIVKYRDCLRQIQKILGDFVVTDFSKKELMTVKAALLARNLGANRQIGILLVLKRFYRYLKEECSLAVL